MSIMCTTPDCKAKAGLCLHEKVLAAFVGLVSVGGLAAVAHFGLKLV